MQPIFVVQGSLNYPMFLCKLPPKQAIDPRLILSKAPPSGQIIAIRYNLAQNYTTAYTVREITEEKVKRKVRIIIFLQSLTVLTCSE